MSFRNEGTREESVPQMSCFANKSLLLLLLLVFSGSAHEQMLLVVADTMDAPTAQLQRYEYHANRWQKTGRPERVNLGRNGLGWGIGIQTLPHAPTDPEKYEGDGRAPAGIFALGPVFGSADTLPTAMPYLQTTGDLICIDDSRSEHYNRIVPIKPNLRFGSFEWMRREDGLYRLGVVVGHNPDALPGQGSCIFLHIERAAGSGTAGCTSMPSKALASIIRWLDPAKEPLLVQVPKKSMPWVSKRFNGVGE